MKVKHGSDYNQSLYKAACSHCHSSTKQRFCALTLALVCLSLSAIYSQMPTSTLLCFIPKALLTLICSTMLYSIILFADFLADTRKLMSSQRCHKCKMCNRNSMASTLVCIINFMENGLLTISQCAVILVNDTKSYTNCSFCFLIY